MVDESDMDISDVEESNELETLRADKNASETAVATLDRRLAELQAEKDALGPVLSENEERRLQKDKNAICSRKRSRVW